MNLRYSKECVIIIEDEPAWQDSKDVSFLIGSYPYSLTRILEENRILEGEENGSLCLILDGNLYDQHGVDVIRNLLDRLNADISSQGDKIRELLKNTYGCTGDRKGFIEELDDQGVSETEFAREKIIEKGWTTRKQLVEIYNTIFNEGR